MSDRCELQTGDMTTMPFPDATFDLVVSSLAIHNIAWREGRFRALDEALRVLKPRGRLLIADLMFTKAYQRHLRSQGIAAGAGHLGWCFWFGALGLATGLVTATKPGLAGAPSAPSPRASPRGSRLA